MGVEIKKVFRCDIQGCDAEAIVDVAPNDNPAYGYIEPEGWLIYNDFCMSSSCADRDKIFGGMRKLPFNRDLCLCPMHAKTLIALNNMFYMGKIKIDNPASENATLSPAYHFHIDEVIPAASADIDHKEES